MKKTESIVGSFVFVAAALVAVPSRCLGQNQILLQGVVSAQCSISVTPNAAASTLPLTTVGAQRITIGTVLQNCNKKTGYTLTAASANCAATPVGAKVLDTVSGENVPYSVEFTNPTTGGSLATVAGLLPPPARPPWAAASPVPRSSMRRAPSG